ncbi:class I SAM-dependent methyltransferase [Solitalea canadensis]|uniref:Methylase involved in ubiquinone/menaquinone biosynthesis n=1 Tax=Solitalea canadensis (strain ATCC 29591 / DSM 3403 / JCM 21819 / LMG 8368 / NBRC 15130 / NCIMB 12057 / USAM 9D) TaxID=929556 RepID=H8KSL1_SOLCM|nr:class I SAM-dependent methyltransferase [Solitalea canadensis]AFD08562.1 methylase involved in ubiquinone/menaquinone biosynthesis [Solitalea canadensis DSM 3403]
MLKEKYLHGFSKTEQERLMRQARFLENYVYADIDLSSVDNILEVGSGVGAQTEILLRRFPNAQLSCIDFSESQIATAKQFLSDNPVATGRYEINQMDATDMDFLSNDKFDGAFLCWVLEHIPNPVKVLSEIRRVLKPGSVVYLTEVLNSSFFLDPYSPNTWQYWMRFNDLQYDMGGDPFIGAKLGNMLQSVGYTNIQTTVKTIHLDNRQPGKRAEMITFWADLLMSGMPNLIEAGYVDQETADKVKEEMKAVSKNPNAVFFYSFVQAKAYTS